MYNALNDSGRDEVGDLPTPLPKPAPRLSRVSTMGREMLASLNRVMAQLSMEVSSLRTSSRHLLRIKRQNMWSKLTPLVEQLMERSIISA